MQPNRELLGRVRDRVVMLGDEHIDMGFWIAHNESEVTTEASSSEMPMCGTTLCFAGTIIVEATGKLSYDEDTDMFTDGNGNTYVQVASLASSLANIDEEWFYSFSWPEKFAEIADNEGDAKAMIAIIDHLMNDFEEEED